MKTTRESIVRLLENYPTMQRQIALLRYEMEHPAHISPSELIGAMSFAKGDGLGTSSGHISDKTLYIAMNYQQKAELLNCEAINDVSKRLMELEQTVDRLHYYLSLLDEKKKTVLHLYYIEHKPWETICQEMSASSKTLRKIREAAIDELTDMYTFTTGEAVT